MATSTDASIADLNVGGVHYTTTMATLTKYPQSMLAHTMDKLVERGWKYIGDCGKDKDFKSKLMETEPDENSLQVFVEANNRIFIDRDGALFRFVLDFLRLGNKFSLPERFAESERLECEAEFYGLKDLLTVVRSQKAGVSGPRKETREGHREVNLPPVTIPSPTGSEFGTGGGSPRVKGNEVVPGSPASFSSAMATSPGLVPPQASPFAGATQRQSSNYTEPGSITVGYRGTFAFGRDGGMADVKFRKLHRILIAGRVQLCKEVFGDTLNESRDPDRGGVDRYTSRFFLKHVFLEQAFDMLYEAGFRMVGSCGSGTNSIGDSKPGMDSEESKWLHYNEFVFVRSYGCLS